MEWVITTAKPSISGVEDGMDLTMDRARELAEFLRSRRNRLRPEQVGLGPRTGDRRVGGLRREEVAHLAGISVAYYTKLERGRVNGVSGSVMRGLVRALRLDDAERVYLAALLSVAGPQAWPESTTPKAAVAARLQRVLDAMPAIPAYIRNDRFEIVAANRFGEALYQPQFANPERPVNTARFLFGDHAARTFFPDWDEIADQAVSYLRASIALAPDDNDLNELIAELAAESSDFHNKWADHNVRFHQDGTKRFNHPLVGELTLDFQAFDVAGQPGLRLNTYTAVPGSRSAERLSALARSL